jgi:protein-tyrosine-phosphatase
MAAKGPLKDAWWVARGQGVSNPEIPRTARSLLFLCKGNICRSPFAALRARRMLLDRRVDGFTCASAGLDTTQAARPPLEARRAAVAFDVSLDEHTPAQVTRELVAKYDLTIVMEADQLIAARRRFPELAGRIVLLPLLRPNATGYARYNIADPFGQPLDAFERCYAEIDDALKPLLGAVVPPQRERAAVLPFARGAR